MTGKRITKEDSPQEHDSESRDELLEMIRRLEEDNNRLKKENDVFRKILRTKRIDADDALTGFSEKDADSTLDEMKELQRKVDMNFENSSMPPSSDRPWHRSKKRSLRTNTGRKAGGQIGQQRKHHVDTA